MSKSISLHVLRVLRALFFKRSAAYIAGISNRDFIGNYGVATHETARTVNASLTIMPVMRFSSVFLVVLGLCFVAMFIGTASSALLPDKMYGADADGTTVTLKKGEALRVSLPENPSTGYSWDLSLSDGLSLVSDQYVRGDTDIRRVGAGGIHTWDIRATGIGSQQITAVYRRPWEVNTAPEKTFTLGVRISGGGDLQSDSGGRWHLPQMFRFSIGKFPPSLMLVN